MKEFDTIATGVISVATIEAAPIIAETTANAVNLPITDILGIFIQVITGVATLYKLFFTKKTKKEEKNV